MFSIFIPFGLLRHSLGCKNPPRPSLHVLDSRLLRLIEMQKARIFFIPRLLNYSFFCFFFFFFAIIDFLPGCRVVIIYFFFSPKLRFYCCRALYCGTNKFFLCPATNFSFIFCTVGAYFEFLRKNLLAIFIVFGTGVLLDSWRYKDYLRVRLENF